MGGLFCFILTYFILKYSQLTSVVIVSGIQQSGSLIHIHVSILSQILSPFRLLHNIAQSSLCYTVGLCWLSFLSIAVYVCQSQILSQSLPPTKGEVTDTGTHMGECHEAAQESSPEQTFLLKSSKGTNQANTQMLDFFPPEP